MQGTVFRVDKNKNYTTMGNFHLRDTHLSLKAKGLLSVILSLPEEWDYSINGLVAISNEGVTAIKSTLKELKDNGYLEIIQQRGALGRINYEYVIHEKPLEIEDLPSTENPPTVNPSTENLETENHIQLNTKELNTKESSKENKKKVPTKLETFKENIKSVYEELNLDSEWQEVFNTWFDYKAERKEYLLPIGIKTCIKKYMKDTDFSVFKVQSIIENSIAHNWQGLYYSPENNKPKIGIDGVPREWKLF